MTKKIKLMHYRLGENVCVVDYNELKVSYFDKNGYHYNLLGAVSDRIEAFLVKKGWIKTTSGTFAKLKDALTVDKISKLANK